MIYALSVSNTLTTVMLVEFIIDVIHSGVSGYQELNVPITFAK